jgi:hypothetical protein
MEEQTKSKKTLGDIDREYQAKSAATSQMPVHASADDRMLCHALVRELVFNSDVRSLCVYDCEEICLTFAEFNAANQNPSEPVFYVVLNALSDTGENTIEVAGKNGETLGWFHLIYHNGSEDDPMICMSDHAANQWTKDLVARVESAVEQGGVEAAEDPDTTVLRIICSVANQNRLKESVTIIGSGEHALNMISP